MISVCELATAHITEAKKILAEEAALHPEWADSIDNLIFPVTYEKRLREEPHLAKFVIAASEFTVNSLLNDGINSEKIVKLPLGYDITQIKFVQRNDDITKRPLHLLYAGTITQRKGIKYLLEAMKHIKNSDVALHIIGGIQGSGQALKQYNKLFNFHPAIGQKDMLNNYQKFDALILPTVFEGFGLVIVEAMAAGLPVITTPNSIGPELITDDINGYIIPIRDIPAVKKAIYLLRNKTNDQFTEMRNRARESAEKYSWDWYKKRVSDMLSFQII